VLMHLLTPLADQYIFFNLFNYITFRAAGGMATATLLALLFGPRTIRWLRTLRFGQVVRAEGPETHLIKAGTPTMGGLLILIATAIATILWADMAGSRYVLITLIVFVWLGALGFLDDYLKVVRRRTEGLVAKYKLIGQGLIGLMVGTALLLWPLPASVEPNTTTLPFVAEFYVKIAIVLYIPWVMFIITGTSNAVNLTDGLDGLAGGLTAIAAATFGVFAYLAGRTDTSRYLDLFYLPGAGELAIFCVSLGGAALGFLWFNAHPAEVFMGDTGSLALGGALGTVALLLKLEFLLAIVGGVFVFEALSVVGQVAYFKYTARKFGQGKRLLRMAPLHHHFEKAGWAESKIIVRFWILGLLCSLIALSTLKIR
jgi:phospho-N-acetylmuramoyl-pentapeptide-transferase